jgi:transmembrane sensor
MKIEYDYDKLLGDYFSGKLNADGRKHVEDWINASEENRAVFLNAEKVWHALNLLEEMKKYDAGKALEKVHDKIGEISHRNKKRFLFYWQRIAAVLLIPLLIATLGIYFFRTTKTPTNPIVWQTISTPNGVRSQIQLPDGTTVWLNSGSKLTYPSIFSANERTVQLAGEAYFEIAKNEQKPFYVDLGKVGIAVTGTTFNVAHYSDEKQTEVVLTSGKVKLVEQEGNKRLDIVEMKPGEKAVYEESSRKITLVQTDTEKHTSWINGYLIFRDDVMTEVVKKLSRQFNVDIEIADPEIAQYVYTATFKDETLEQILFLLQKTSPISYTIQPAKQLNNGSFEAQKIILKKEKTHDISNNCLLLQYSKRSMLFSRKR